MTLKLQVTKKKKPNNPNAPAISFSNDVNTGIFMPGNQPIISFSTSGTDKLEVESDSAELMDLYIQGKDVIKDKTEYLDVIMRLPYVKNDNLKAIEVFERWKKTQKLLNKSEAKDEL